MKTEDFDYVLPSHLIAQSPAKERHESRLLILGGASNAHHDASFSAFIGCCDEGDLLVLNDTRVVPARLKCHKASGGQVEVMLEQLLNENEFLALARSNKKLKTGAKLQIQGEDKLEYIARDGVFFKFKILDQNCTGFELFHRYGEVPLPPYIKRDLQSTDTQRYQTVYAKNDGAVAAPTAGLHFDESILTALKQKGVNIAYITLHVGAGTFQPVKVDDVREHKMHQEHLSVSEAAVRRIKQTKAAGKRVIAIGTTTVRALESAAQFSDNNDIAAYHGLSDIFIYPGYEFKVVDALLTNFHLPKSTLLMMISAFAGIEKIKAAYAHAIKQEYRFFSYGDAMFLTRNRPLTNTK